MSASFTKGKSINTLVELLHKNDEAAAQVQKDLKNDKEKKKAARKQHKALIDALIQADFDKRWEEERKRKYAKWAGKQDEKAKRKAFKAKKDSMREAHKAAVKKARKDEKQRRKAAKATKKKNGKK